MKLKKHIFAHLLLVVMFSMPFFVGFAHAQTQSVNVTSNTPTVGTKSDPEGMYSYIAPLGENFTGTIDLRDDKTLTDYLQKWFRFAIGLAGVFGVVRLVMVGFTIITSAESVTAQDKIKKELTAIIGALLLMAGSWIFLNTISPKLVTQNLLIPVSTGTGQMRQVCSEADKSNCADLTPRDSTGNPVGTDGRGNILLADNVTMGLTRDGYYFLVSQKKDGVKYWVGPFSSVSSCKDNAIIRRDDETADVTVDLPQGTQEPSCIDYRTDISPDFKATEESGRKTLLEGGVRVNHSACTNPLVGKGCTNLTGLSQEVYTNLIGLAGNCKGQMGKDCTIELTGGTEAGHSTHGRNANYTFDIAATPLTTEFLKKNATVIAPSFSKVEPNIRFYYLGWWYTYEGMGGTKLGTGIHYHVCMANASGHVEAKRWYCNDQYLNRGGVVPMNMDSCPINPKNQNQRLCLGVQI